MPITDWPAAERPRERLLAAGPQALSDAELLAVLLRTGSRGRSAVELARDLLVRLGGLNGVFGAATAELRATTGLGAAKVAQLRACLELARRSVGEQLVARDVLSSPLAVRSYLHLAMRSLPHEVFMVLFLDAQHRVVASEEIFRGTLDQTSVHPREIVKAALRHNAASVILAHNHPSGAAEPSEADRRLTRVLQQALGLVDVRVLDHLIVAGRDTVSFVERGLL
jgi:DNA repair protein RadC